MTHDRVPEGRWSSCQWLRMQMRKDARGTCLRYQIEFSPQVTLVHLDSIPTVILRVNWRACRPALRTHAYLVRAILSSNQEVDVVYTKRNEFAVWALQRHKQSTERSIHLTVDPSRQL